MICASLWVVDGKCFGNPQDIDVLMESVSNKVLNVLAQDTWTLDITHVAGLQFNPESSVFIQAA